MSKNDIKTEIVFGASVALTKMLVDEYKHEGYMEYQKEKAAMDLGIKISEKKGWKVNELDDLIVLDMRLYIFTPAELRDYMNAKFKAKLQHMAATESYLSKEQREALMIQSERF